MYHLASLGPGMYTMILLRTDGQFIGVELHDIVEHACEC